MIRTLPYSPFFFFNDTATTEIYTLSLHDALPISHLGLPESMIMPLAILEISCVVIYLIPATSVLGAILLTGRSEEHTSELQSLAYLVCRLLLEKKKQYIKLVSV